MTPGSIQPFLAIALRLGMLSVVLSVKSLRWTDERNGKPQLATPERRRAQRRTLIALAYPLFAAGTVGDTIHRTGKAGALPAYVAGALGAVVWILLLRAAKPLRS